MSASTTKLLFNLLLICVVLDVVTRYFEKPPIRRTSQKNNPSKENKYENPLKDVDIDTSLDEDDDDFSDTKKKKPKKSKVNETEEDEEEKEKEKIKEKKSKKKKKKKSEDDEEEEERNVITIIYDKKSYQKYYDNLKNQILGNFTNFDVEEKEYPLPPNKKFFSKITFFTQRMYCFSIFKNYFCTLSIFSYYALSSGDTIPKFSFIYFSTRISYFSIS